MTDIQVIDEQDINWSGAAAFRKASTLAKDKVRLSNGNEHIVTLNDNGAIEREGDAKAGDSIVMDSRGQEYIITKEKFSTLYEESPDDPKVFRSKNFGVAVQVDKPMSVKRADGQIITTDALGWLFKSATTGTVNHIASTEFTKTYKPEKPSLVI